MLWECKKPTRVSQISLSQGKQMVCKKIKTKHKTRYPTAPIPVEHNEEVISSLFLIVCQKETPRPAFPSSLALPSGYSQGKAPLTWPSCQRLNLRQRVGDSRKENISLLSLPLLLIGNPPVLLKVIYIINSSPVSKTEALTGKDLKKGQSLVSQTQQKSFFGRQSSWREWNIIWKMHIHMQSRTTLIQWLGHVPIPHAFEKSNWEYLSSGTDFSGRHPPSRHLSGFPPLRVTLFLIPPPPPTLYLRT